MNEFEKSDRRIEISASISNYVYTFENEYTSGNNEASFLVNEKLAKEFDNSVTIIDSMYDKNTGVAAIAVEDELTGETYIAFAGTNVGADGIKDIISDTAIGLNDSLYLKELNQSALKFYDQVAAQQKNITTLTGHSYGVFHSARTAIERQVPYQYGYQGAPGSVNGKTAQQLSHDGGESIIHSIINQSSNFEEFSKLIFEITHPMYPDPKAFALQTIYPSPTYLNKFKRLKLIEVPENIQKELYDYFHRLHNVTEEDVRKSIQESERVVQLIKEYSGSSFIFSSTRDILTNITWKQDSNEIDFGGQVLSEKYQDDILNRYTGNILEILGITKDTKYPGHVVAIDVPIFHDMLAFRSNEEAMRLSKQVARMQLKEVDIDGDGISDFTISPMNTSLTPLLPSSDENRQILLNFKSMSILLMNLKNCKYQVQELSELINKMISKNQQIMETANNRRVNLKHVISQFLESTHLIKAIQEINTTYEEYGMLNQKMTILSQYELNDFVRKFNYIGESSELLFYKNNESQPWNYTEVRDKLYNMTLKSLEVKLDIEKQSGWALRTSFEYGDMGLCPSVGLSTPLAVKGQHLINSFEGMINQSTQGLDRRSHYADGIPEALNEILQVVQQNIHTILECMNYTISVAQVILSSFEETDNSLATSISTYDFSTLLHINTSVAITYNDYLQQSGIFDDRDVLQAFDNQIDVRATELAGEMEFQFTNYLDEVKEQVTFTNKCMTSFKEIATDLKRESINMLYSSPKALNGKKLASGEDFKRQYGTIGQQISVMDTILSAISEVDLVDEKLTNAATTINLTLTMLGGFYQPFRDAMEDAFYGMAELESIVNAQKAVGTVLSAMQVRFSQLQADLATLGSGVAVDALGSKLGDMITLMGYVTTVIQDCFGGHESYVSYQVHARRMQVQQFRNMNQLSPQY